VTAGAQTPAPRLTTLRFEDTQVGDALPVVEIPLTRTLIVSTAIATRDYQDVHHDHTLAVARGSKDIFMNIISTNGLVGRYLTDWTGPGGVLTDPNYPDDTMVLTGSVTGRDEAPAEDGYGTVEVTLRGANSLGDHVSGTALVRLPGRQSPVP
jgi:hypothetical protein